jgi:hypothetical protein
MLEELQSVYQFSPDVFVYEIYAVFTAVNIHIVEVWVMIPSSFVN